MKEKKNNDIVLLFTANQSLRGRGKTLTYLVTQRNRRPKSKGELNVQEKEDREKKWLLFSKSLIGTSIIYSHIHLHKENKNGEKQRKKQMTGNVLWVYPLHQRIPFSGLEALAKKNLSSLWFSGHIIDFVQIKQNSKSVFNLHNAKKPVDEAHLLRTGYLRP